jgi:hypothetical protein
MSPQLQSYLPLASFVVAALALLVSLLSAFPGLRTALAVVRDGVLWVALFFVIGGIGFIAWQRLQSPANEVTAGNFHAPELTRAESASGAPSAP